MKNPGLLYGIASIFFGVISIAVCMIFFISFPAAVLAITFGAFAIKRVLSPLRITVANSALNVPQLIWQRDLSHLPKETYSNTN